MVFFWPFVTSPWGQGNGEKRSSADAPPQHAPMMSRSPFNRRVWLSLASAAVLASFVAAGLELCWFGYGCRAPAPLPPPSASAVVKAGEDATIGWIDAPSAEAVVSNEVLMNGWTLDRAGVRAMELKIDGQSLPIRY